VGGGGVLGVGVYYNKAGNAPGLNSGCLTVENAIIGYKSHIFFGKQAVNQPRITTPPTCFWMRVQDCKESIQEKDNRINSDSMDYIT
jgi:hypothetical protein